MKFPKTVRKYCPYCKKYTEHRVRRVKVGARNRRPLAWTERQKKRAIKGHGGSGRFSKPPAQKKPTQKVDLRYQCMECKREHIIGKGFRVKKFELE